MRPLVEPASGLSGEEARRYARHLVLPGLGEQGQRRLKNARVLVVGAGGLGSPVLLYLAAAGVGTIGVVDGDDVDVTNLQRQVVHGVDDVGRAKVDSAAESLARLNPHVEVRRHHQRLGPDTALQVLAGYDLVVDGADNFPTRYLVGDACEVLNLPCVWGSIYTFDGQVSVFWARPPDGAGLTYRDLHPTPPAPGAVPSCEQAGVLGAVCAAIGSAMALEAVKLITGIGEPLLGRLLVFDGLRASWRSLDVRPIPGRVPVTALDTPPDTSPAAGPTTHPAGVGPEELPPEALARLLAAAEVTLIDVREPWERQICVIEQAVPVPVSRWQAPGGAAELLAVLEAARAGRPAVLHCRSGARSEQVLQALRSAGAGRGELAGHLRGGILAWIDEIEPGLSRY